MTDNANALVATSSGGNWGVDNLGNPDYAAVGTTLFADCEATWSDSKSGAPWYALALDGVNIAMDALGFAMDPFGRLLGAGIGWLIEHIGFLKKPLDYLAGDPVAVTDKEQTWKNIADKLRQVSQDYQQLAQNLTSQHQGQAAEAYQGAVKSFVAALDAAAGHVDNAATAMKSAAVIVGITRGMIRDSLGQFIADAIIKFIAAQALSVVTFGASEVAFVVDEVAEGVSLAAENAGKVAHVVEQLGEMGRNAANSEKTFKQATDQLNSSSVHDLGGGPSNSVGAPHDSSDPGTAGTSLSDATPPAQHDDDPFATWLAADNHFNGPGAQHTDTGGGGPHSESGGSHPDPGEEVGGQTVSSDATPPSSPHPSDPESAAATHDSSADGASASDHQSDSSSTASSSSQPYGDRANDFKQQANAHSSQVEQHNLQVSSFQNRLDQYNQEARTHAQNVADNKAALAENDAALANVHTMSPAERQANTEQRANLLLDAHNLNQRGHNLTEEGQSLDGEGRQLNMQGRQLNNQADDLAKEKQELAGGWAEGKGIGQLVGPVDKWLDQHGIGGNPVHKIGSTLSEENHSFINGSNWGWTKIPRPTLADGFHVMLGFEHPYLVAGLGLRAATQGNEMQPTYEGHVSQDYENQLKTNPDPYPAEN